MYFTYDMINKFFQIQIIADIFFSNFSHRISYVRMVEVRELIPIWFLYTIIIIQYHIAELQRFKMELISFTPLTNL
jgi:hypothetical protein